VRIVVDGRVRVPLESLSEAQAQAIRSAFTHANPNFGKDPRRAGEEPPTYKTWEHDADGNLTVPRGGLAKVEEVLGRNPGSVLDDRRTWRHPEPDFPDHRKAPRDYQREMVAATDAHDHGLVISPTGCIDGDALIGVNRAGKGSQMKLSHVVRMFNGGRAQNRIWDPSIPTYVRAPFDDGTVRLARLGGAVESGLKPVYEVLVSGYGPVLATDDHRFKTPFGWVPLCDLVEGDYVLVDGGIPRGRLSKKPWYRLRVCRKHPFAGRRGVNPAKGGWTVPLHRLIAEARLNGLSLLDFLCQVEAGREGLRFLDPEEWVVHHKDGDSLNNEPDNLEVVTHEEHRGLHLTESKRNVEARLVPERVRGIRYAGERMTFDLQVEHAHAFIANGVAVHNSGKTTSGYGIVAHHKRRSLVMLCSTALLKQWRERAVEELGLEPEEVGHIQGDRETIRPLTLCMQMTMANRFRAGAGELGDAFDVFLFDEVQRAPADTVFAAIDPIRARKRYGLSADHTRKDRLEFFTYDLIGSVICRIPEERVLASGSIVDVEVACVPTRFSAPWYKYRQDFNLLLEKMTADPARNAQVLALVRSAVASGEQVIVFTHRVEHARYLDAQVAQMGIPGGLMLGGAAEAAEFDRTKSRLKEGKLRVAVGTYQAIGEGIDVPAVARGVAATPMGNNAQKLGQVKGRLCRSADGKEKGRLAYLLDTAVYGRRPVENFVKWYRDVTVWDGARWLTGKEWLVGVRSRR